MTYHIIFTKPALRDLDEIGEYMSSVAGYAAAERLSEDIIGTIETLRTMPTRQRERVELAPGLRGLSSGNYMIFYRVRSDTVSVVRILHGSRNSSARLFRRPPAVRDT